MTRPKFSRFRCADIFVTLKQLDEQRKIGYQHIMVLKFFGVRYPRFSASTLVEVIEGNLPELEANGLLSPTAVHVSHPCCKLDDEAPTMLPPHR